MGYRANVDDMNGEAMNTDDLNAKDEKVSGGNMSGDDAGPDATASVETTYPVLGMTCGHCAASVTGELLGIPTVTSASVDLQAATATVVSRTALDEADVRAAVEEAGYVLGHPGALPMA